MLAANDTIILGGGFTGLAAGLASGYPIFEARDVVGGICSSYYLRPGELERLPAVPSDGEAYRFEYGGGHWIFGGDPAVLELLEKLAPTKSYQRRSAVYFPDTGLLVPYPVQNHLSYLGEEIAAKALGEMAQAPAAIARTLSEWIEQTFGPTLARLFFGPFHELYTAGLWKTIAPQDAYKSPGGLKLAIQGAFGQAPPVGYNASFRYPVEGLNALAGRMAARCKVISNKRVTRIDPNQRRVYFADGTEVGYRRLISTLPLNQTCALSETRLDEQPDPYTSVLVVNIGGLKGPRCPEEHWIYVPASGPRFHRVGFYSNVDSSFLPRSSQAKGDRVSIYVEKAYPGGNSPPEEDLTRLCGAIVDELKGWGFLREAEVVDPTWIDVAYTWSWPGSGWRTKALRALLERHIQPVGRYGRWIFQGIADSIRDGLMVGSAVRQSE